MVVFLNNLFSFVKIQCFLDPVLNSIILRALLWWTGLYYKGDCVYCILGSLQISTCLRVKKAEGSSLYIYILFCWDDASVKGIWEQNLLCIAVGGRYHIFHIFGQMVPCFYCYYFKLCLGLIAEGSWLWTVTAFLHILVVKGH